jgi:hypothetical protein
MTMKVLAAMIAMLLWVSPPQLEPPSTPPNIRLVSADHWSVPDLSEETEPWRALKKSSG